MSPQLPYSCPCFSEVLRSCCCPRVSQRQRAVGLASSCAVSLPPFPRVRSRRTPTPCTGVRGVAGEHPALCVGRSLSKCHGKCLRGSASILPKASPSSLPEEGGTRARGYQSEGFPGGCQLSQAHQGDALGALGVEGPQRGLPLSPPQCVLGLPQALQLS